MGFLQEFKEFAMKGNVVDLAVGVIIGAAFGKIVDSLVKDIVMPIIGRIVGGLDFSYLYVNLSSQTYESLAAAEKAGAPVLRYGSFLTILLNFLVVAFVIFLAVKAMNRLKRETPVVEPVEPPSSGGVRLLREIRGSLKK